MIGGMTMLRGIDDAVAIAVRDRRDGTVVIATRGESMHIQIVERLAPAGNLWDDDYSIARYQTGVLCANGRFVQV